MYQMTRQEAENKMKQWMRMGMVEREPFTSEFTHTTQKATSKELFEAAVKALGGWVVENGSFYYAPSRYASSRRHLTTTAIIHDDEILNYAADRS